MSPRFDEPDPSIDLRRPSVARMHDVFLGGKDHYPVDREAARKAVAADPSFPQAIRANRGFALRAVGHCARAGVRQFLDVGTGIPNAPTVVETARQVCSDVRVVGVDNDPMVLVHNSARVPGARFVRGDLRKPDRILDHPVVCGEIDWAEPVAVLLTAVLHLLSDADDPAGVVAAFRDRLAPGSMVVISHLCSTGAGSGVVGEIQDVYAGTGTPLVFRTHEQICRLFAGLLLVDPGAVLVQDWPRCSGRRDLVPVLGGIGCIPPAPAGEGCHGR